MSWWPELSVRGPSAEELLERSLIECARSEMEKNAGELTESLNSLLGQKDLTPKLDNLQRQTKLAMRMGRELAHREKQAGIAGTIMNAAKPLVTKGLSYAAKNPGRAMAAGGAAVGALGGAATAQPGHRMSGALGGAALGGAAGFGLSKIPSGQALQQGVTRYANQGLAKLALAVGRAGIAGAALGGVAGALHKSPAEAQGLEAGHHLRNALVGAAGGAAMGTAAKKVPTMLGRAEGAVARSGAALGHNPHLPTGTPTPAGWGGNYSPTDLRQMQRVKSVANSTVAGQARAARGAQALRGAQPAAAPGSGAATIGIRKSPAPTGFEPTIAKMAQRGGREFLKLAVSMSAQAEPGTPSGAQEPEAESQFQARPTSKPAMELYDTLKHLSPKKMRGLQVAQPMT